MKQSNLPAWLGVIITNVTAALSSNEIAQLILYILGIASAVFSLCWNIWTWVKQAKKDGLITDAEVKDLADNVGDGVKQIADSIDKKGDSKNGSDGNDQETH